MRPNWQRLACVLTLLLLAACGSGGGGTTAPGAPTLNLAFGLKELRFSWVAVSGADFYRLFENPDGVAGFSQIGGDLTALTFNHTIAVHRRASASYRLDACNSAGCTASSVVTLGTNLTQAIGYVKASNPGAGDSFGRAIALSADGNTLAVTAIFEDSSTTGLNTSADENAADAGAVYVFVRSGSGWTQQAYIKPSNTGTGDNFGRAVALSGDGNTLAVTAPWEDSSTTGVNTTPDESASEAGAVYVFIRTAGVWSQQAYIKPSNAGVFDFFGDAVALSADGNTLAVGAAFEDSSTTGVNSTPNAQADTSGAVYVFTRSGTAWSQEAYIKASNTGSFDFFGLKVALSADGNTLAVGAPGEDSGTTGVNSAPDENAASAGAVYVFTRSAGMWSQQAYIKASNTGAGDFFGIAVALSADANTLAVGAFSEDSGTTGVNSAPGESAVNAGAVYVFTRSAAVWSQQAYIKASNTEGGDFFGGAVALNADGNTLAVGAEGEDSSTIGVNGAPNESGGLSGAVYVFTLNSGVWSQQAFVKASNTSSDRFGVSVALSADGNTLVVGADLEDSSTTGVNSTPNEAAADAGAVYLY